MCTETVESPRTHDRACPTAFVQCIRQLSRLIRNVCAPDKHNTCEQKQHHETMVRCTNKQKWIINNRPCNRKNNINMIELSDSHSSTASVPLDSSVSRTSMGAAKIQMTPSAISRKHKPPTISRRSKSEIVVNTSFAFKNILKRRQVFEKILVTTKMHKNEQKDIVHGNLSTDEYTSQKSRRMQIHQLSESDGM